MGTLNFLMPYIASAFVLYSSYSQEDKQAYLKNNSSVLGKSYVFPQKNINVVGFGAYHGSSKTEEAELFLIQSLLKSGSLQYYFPETDASIAYYFNEYLKSGDEILLKDLIIHYGTRIPQERTVNVFNKWKRLREINNKLSKNKKIQVLGADPIVTYKYTYRHLLTLIKNNNMWVKVKELQNTVNIDTTDFSPYYDSYSKQQLKAFITDYEAHQNTYNQLIKNKEMFDYLMASIKISFTNLSREKEIYNNYLKLVEIYNIEDKIQFFRYGFFHLLKAKEGKYASFFSMLADNKIYPKKKIISVLGYLTKSEVIWKDNYDNDGNYKNSENKGDDGIGDSPEEYFRGIKNLKQQKIDDITIFRLNKNESPYREGGPDLIEVITTDIAIDKINYDNAATVNFIDYAILISNSKASKSIYSLP